jgi:hypothetical protein
MLFDIQLPQTPKLAISNKQICSTQKPETYNSCFHSSYISCGIKPGENPITGVAGKKEQEKQGRSVSQLD